MVLLNVLVKKQQTVGKKIIKMREQRYYKKFWKVGTMENSYTGVINSQVKPWQ